MIKENKKMKTLIILLTTLLTGQHGGNFHAVEVDRIEDNNIAIIATHYKNDYKMIDVSQEEFNTPIKEGQKINHEIVYGKFHGDGMEMQDIQGNSEICYQFKSYDNSVWWLLTVEEIGEIPDTTTEYALIYSNNGTTKENKTCNCLPEFECECELYDDIFLGIFKEEHAPDFIDLNEIVGYDTTEHGILLHTSDGSGYFIEK
jgi:hypothetical protein